MKYSEEIDKKSGGSRRRLNIQIMTKKTGIAVKIILNDNLVPNEFI